MMSSHVFVCPFEACEKKYRNYKSYKRHIDAFHRATIKYQCEICLKRVTSNQALKEHKNIHTGEKPFVCPEEGCNARFRQGSLLSSHKKSHRNQRDFSKTFVELKLTSLLQFDRRILDYKPILEFEESNETVVLPPILGQFGLSTNN